MTSQTQKRPALAGLFFMPIMKRLCLFAMIVTFPTHKYICLRTIHHAVTIRVVMGSRIIHEPMFLRLTTHRRRRLALVAVLVFALAHYIRD